MKLSTKQLKEIISKLPDPNSNKFPNCIRIIVQDPRIIAISKIEIPNKFEKDYYTLILEFKRDIFDYGYDWVLQNELN